MGAARRLAPQICRSFRRGFSGLATSGGSSASQDRLCERLTAILCPASNAQLFHLGAV